MCHFLNLPFFTRPNRDAGGIDGRRELAREDTSVSAYSANLRLSKRHLVQERIATPTTRPIACIPGEYIFDSAVSREAKADIANQRC